MLTSRIKKFTLMDVTGGPLPAFSPGSHIVLNLKHQDRRWSNSYSLIGDPSEKRFYQIAVRKEELDRSKGGSIYLHEYVQEGAEFEIKTPRNFFPIARNARKHVLVAGGIGITPFLSYLPVLSRQATPFELHYAYREDSSGAFTGMLGEAYPEEARFYISREGRRLSPIALLAEQPLGTHIYTCGPHSLISAVSGAAAELGLPQSCIHFEEFAPPVLNDAEPFLVSLPELGLKVKVGARETLLEALENANVPIPSSCRVGQCGTCELNVLGGSPDHRDRCLTEDEWAMGRFLACVSRCHGDQLDVALPY